MRSILILRVMGWTASESSITLQNVCWMKSISHFRQLTRRSERCSSCSHLIVNRTRTDTAIIIDNHNDCWLHHFTQHCTVVSDDDQSTRESDWGKEMNRNVRSHDINYLLGECAKWIMEHVILIVNQYIIVACGFYLYSLTTTVLLIAHRTCARAAINN